jgi:hypothetical protein
LAISRSFRFSSEHRNIEEGFLMNATVELLQDDGSVKRFTAPTGRWYTEPTATAYDAEQVLRDAQQLDRALGSAELALDVLRRYRPDMQALVSLAHDPQAWLAARLPIETTQQAKAMLSRLVEALGADGYIATPGGLPYPDLSLAHCGERLRDVEAEIQRVQSAFVPRAAAGGRRAG